MMMAGISSLLATFYFTIFTLYMYSRFVAFMGEP